MFSIFNIKKDNATLLHLNNLVGSMKVFFSTTVTKKSSKNGKKRKIEKQMQATGSKGVSLLIKKVSTKKVPVKTTIQIPGRKVISAKFKTKLNSRVSPRAFNKKLKAPNRFFKSLIGQWKYNRRWRTRNFLALLTMEEFLTQPQFLVKRWFFFKRRKLGGKILKKRRWQLFVFQQ